MGIAFEIETSNLKQPCIYIQTAASKPHGKCKPKSTIDTHKKIKKQPKHNTKDSHHTIREANKRGREEERP